MEEFDLFVMGGGSAGLKAARMAARRGLKVGVAEDKELGGECFWAGCVPTKALVRAAEVWHEVKDTSRFGIEVKVERFDFCEAMAYKDYIMRRMAGDGPSDGGLSKLGARYFPFRASFLEPGAARVGEETVRFRNALISTGTVPAVPDIPGLLEAGFITNREAIHLPSLPARIVVFGGGPIGLEFAQVFRRFGAEVMVFDKSPAILIKEDEEISALAQTALEREGIVIKSGMKKISITHEGTVKTVRYEENGEMQETVCDEILVGTGRRAAVEGMDLEAVGLKLENNRVTVDGTLRTASKGIWAAGDVTGSPLFTHVASYAGAIMAKNLLEEGREETDYRVVPRCTYLAPEVASVGVTEQEARKLGLDYRVSRVDLADMDRHIMYGEPFGMVKLIFERGTGKILGGHIIGHDASSMISEITVCMRNGLPVQAIAATMHAYPSFPEAVEAAALRAKL